MKNVLVLFTRIEIQHLLTLITDNAREGWYYGQKETYWSRSEVIKQKLETAALETKR